MHMCNSNVYSIFYIIMLYMLYDSLLNLALDLLHYSFMQQMFDEEIFDGCMNILVRKL